MQVANRIKEKTVTDHWVITQILISKPVKFPVKVPTSSGKIVVD